MSKIFKAFEKAWESRHAAPLVVLRDDTSATCPAAVPAAAAHRNGAAHATTPGSIPPPPPSIIPQLEAARLCLADGVPMLPFDGADPQAAEQYKIIRTRILHHPAQPRSLVVSSAQTEDGKSVTAVNVAGCLALKEKTTVLLVDADLRRSSLAEMLGVPSAPGLADVLAGGSSLERAIVRLEPFSNLFFLPKGDRQGSPTELLDSTGWRAVSSALRKEFDYVVIDAPPIGLVADYDLVEAVSDGVILVIRPDHTNRALGLKALNSIHPDRLIGVVLNCAPDWFLARPFGHGYYHYYGDKR